MQNLLTASQMKLADDYTITHQSLLPIDLMERAAMAFVKIFKKEVDKNTRIAVLCGQGNNGGDGLAIARLLWKAGYKKLRVYHIFFSRKESDGFKQNLKRLAKTEVPVLRIDDPKTLKLESDVIVDAILGSGVNKPLTGKYLDLVRQVNSLNKKVIAVDIPTGLGCDGEIDQDGEMVKADLTITFQLPKLSFFFPESIKAMDRFEVANIGLDESFIARQVSAWKLTTKEYVKTLVRVRRKFSHKGTYGHALIVAGNTTTMGAALLAAKACVNIGAGLTTACVPQSGLVALNTALPEVMAMPRTKYLSFETLERFNVVAIGPGLGVDEDSEYLLELLIELGKPLVLDADALHVLSLRRDLLDRLPEQSILTPHVKEFDRLFGEHRSWWQRVEVAREMAMNKKLNIVLKNQYTFNCLSSGEVVINSTGNPAMASGGMGDVLTGMMTGLLAQSYPPAHAVILASYLHGKSGDMLARKSYTVTASQVAEASPRTLMKISQ